MKIKYVIHGATSFIGKHLIRELITSEIGTLILCRTTSNVEEFQNSQNIEIKRYKKSAKEITIDSTLFSEDPIFIELAWDGVFGEQRNNMTQFSTNIPLFINNILWCSNNKIKHWIGFGSQAEYGNLNKEISEEDNCDPTTFYGNSKLILSKVSKELCGHLGIEHTWLRLFSVYGPDDNHEWFLQYCIKEMLQNNSLKLTKGEQKWDYLYVSDIVQALLLIKPDQGLGITNLSSNSPISIKDLVIKVKHLLNSNSELKFGAIEYRSDQVMLMNGNNSKLMDSIKWKPETGLNEGLNNLIKFLKDGN